MKDLELVISPLVNQSREIIRPLQVRKLLEPDGVVVTNFLVASLAGGEVTVSRKGAVHS